MIFIFSPNFSFLSLKFFVQLNPMILINKPIKVIRSDIIRIKNELAPCDIVMADIDPKTPDKNNLSGVFKIVFISQPLSHCRFYLLVTLPCNIQAIGFLFQG